MLWGAVGVSPRGCSSSELPGLEARSQVMSPSPIPLKVPTAQAGLFQQVTDDTFLAAGSRRKG